MKRAGIFANPRGKFLAAFFVIAALMAACKPCNGPDGGGDEGELKIYFAAAPETNGSTAIYESDKDGREIRKITNFGLLFSPPSDSREIAFLAKDEATGENVIYRSDLNGANLKEIKRDIQSAVKISYPIFSPKGNKIAYIDGSNRLLITGDGNQTDVLSTELLTGSIPAFSPDGNKLAFLTGENTPGNIGVEIIDPNNTDSKIILFSGIFPGYTVKQGILPRIMWSGDSREITLAFKGDSADFIEIIETETGARVTIEISAVLGAAQPDISPGRDFVAFVSDDGKIWARNIEGQPKFFEISKLTSERKNLLPEWAPEEGKVLYHSAGSSGQLSSFYTLFAADYQIAGNVLTVNGLTVISNNVYRGFWKIK